MNRPEHEWTDPHLSPAERRVNVTVTAEGGAVKLRIDCRTEGDGAGPDVAMSTTPHNARHIADTLYAAAEAAEKQMPRFPK